MESSTRLVATLYLLGYNIACYKCYEGYLRDFQDENDMLQRAFAYNLKQARDVGIQVWVISACAA
jgi:hypothetical protein